jgi:hypothetical protein
MVVTGWAAAATAAVGSVAESFVAAARARAVVVGTTAVGAAAAVRQA